ncbi:MAG: D-alanyl-D-alanine carboxypeptidase family protein [Bacillota bacterium]
MPLNDAQKRRFTPWRRFVCGLLLLAIGWLPITDGPTAAAAEETMQPSSLSSAGALLMDLDTGQILYEKQADQPFYPASITKILTAIVAIENGDLDDVVTVSENAVRADGTRVYLVPGEQKTLRELLYAMMVNSGNDAAVAIAEHIAGSVEAFAQLMNQKAADLGATHSHFVNPSGLHDDNHYTTAYDMAIIAQYAMRNPVFREIVQTKTMPWNGDEWQSQLVNHNRLLWQYEGATGIKNGYTSKAKQTFVATAKKGETELLAVCLQAPSQAAMYNDLITLLNYGFEAYEAVPAVSKNDRFYPPDRSVEVAMRTSRDIRILRPIYTSEGEEPPAVVTKVVMDDVQYPIHKGQQVGQLHISLGNKPIVQAPLYAAEAVVPPTPTKQEEFTASGAPLWLAVALAALAGLGWVVVYRQKRVLRRWKVPVPLDRKNTIH